MRNIFVSKSSKKQFWYNITFYIMSLITLNVFCPYIEGHFLSFIPFTLLLVLFVISALFSRRRISKTSAFYLVTVIFFLSWFYICLYKHSNMISYKRMILSISIALISSILILEIIDNLSVNLIIGIIVLSSIVTILISVPYIKDNYLIVRTMATGTIEIDKKLGIGGYDFIYCLSLLSPVLLISLKVTNGIKRIIIAIALALSIFYSVICGLAITIIITLFGFALYFLLGIKNVRTRRFIIISLVLMSTFIFLFGADILVSFFSWLSSISNNTIIKDKAYDIILLLKGVSEQHGTISGRITRYNISIETFFDSPIWGGFLFDSNAKFGGHSTILDYCALTGLIGVGSYIAIIINIYKKAASILRTKLAKYVLWEVFFMYSLLVATKNVGYASIVWTVFLLTPCVIVWADKLISKGVES